MAIEVISRMHQSAVKTVICRNCGAELRFTMADTYKRTTTDYTGCKDIDTGIDCPDCKNFIHVS